MVKIINKINAEGAVLKNIKEFNLESIFKSDLNKTQIKSLKIVLILAKIKKKEIQKTDLKSVKVKPRTLFFKLRKADIIDNQGKIDKEKIKNLGDNFAGIGTESTTALKKILEEFSEISDLESKKIKEKLLQVLNAKVKAETLNSEIKNLVFQFLQELSLYYSKLKDKRFEKQFKKIKTGFFQTRDKQDYLHFVTLEGKNTPEDAPLILNFTGNEGKLSQNVAEWSKNINKNKFCWASYSRRGEELSSLSNTKNICEGAAYLDAVEFILLMAEKYPERDIILDAYSLGGGIATGALLIIAKNYPNILKRIKLVFMDRTFNNLSHVLKNGCADIIGGRIGAVVGNLGKGVTKLLPKAPKSIQKIMRELDIKEDNMNSEQKLEELRKLGKKIPKMKIPEMLFIRFTKDQMMKKDMIDANIKARYESEENRIDKDEFIKQYKDRVPDSGIEVSEFTNIWKKLKDKIGDTKTKDMLTFVELNLEKIRGLKKENISKINNKLDLKAVQDILREACHLIEKSGDHHTTFKDKYKEINKIYTRGRDKENNKIVEDNTTKGEKSVYRFSNKDLKYNSDDPLIKLMRKLLPKTMQVLLPEGSSYINNVFTGKVKKKEGFDLDKAFFNTLVGTFIYKKVNFSWELYNQVIMVLYYLHKYQPDQKEQISNLKKAFLKDIKKMMNENADVKSLIFVKALNDCLTTLGEQGSKTRKNPTQFIFNALFKLKILGLNNLDKGGAIENFLYEAMIKLQDKSLNKKGREDLIKTIHQKTCMLYNIMLTQNIETPKDIKDLFEVMKNI
ncbi:hypothetical protein ACFL5N_02745, partial [bacterium]